MIEPYSCYEDEYYDKFEKKESGVVVERIPRYWNNKCIDEEINVALQYQASHFKNRKEMYKQIFNDIEKIKESLLEAQKVLEREEK